MVKVILITDVRSGTGKITSRCLNENGYTVKDVIEDEKLSDENFDVKIKEKLFYTLSYL
jgi:hypothetical protein